MSTRSVSWQTVDIIYRYASTLRSILCFLNLGHGVYLKTSIMSHSCVANTKTLMNEDQTVDVRAVMAIKAGTEITKSYVSSMETTQMRQEKLLSGWYFKCKCLRCIDPLEALSFTSSVACLRCRFEIWNR